MWPLEREDFGQGKALRTSGWTSTTEQERSSGQKIPLFSHHPAKPQIPQPHPNQRLQF
jgi:hypothetical protein